MSSLALAVLTLILGMFFVLIGQFKVTPWFFPNVYEDMKQEFGRNNKVFPFYQWTGWRPYARNYRLAVGITEIVCGTILILIPGRLKQLANLILLLLMLGAVYTHYALHDKFDRMAPGIIFSLLLFTRFIISHHSSYFTPPQTTNQSNQLPSNLTQDDQEARVPSETKLKTFREKKKD